MKKILMVGLVLGLAVCGLALAEILNLDYNKDGKVSVEEHDYYLNSEYITWSSDHSVTPGTFGTPKQQIWDRNDDGRISPAEYSYMFNQGYTYPCCTILVVDTVWLPTDSLLTEFWEQFDRLVDSLLKEMFDEKKR